MGVIGFPSHTDWLSDPGLIDTKLDNAFTVIEPVVGAPTQPVTELTGII